MMCFEAFKEENSRRPGGVVFIHVKGHSNDLGNDKADDRVQWGKDEGPYCRFAVDGTFEGDYMDQPRPEQAATATDETPHHPSPSKRFNPLKSFETNLSSIRHREEPDSTPSVHSTSDKRSTHLRSRTSTSNLSCRRNLFASIYDVSPITDKPNCHTTPNEDNPDVCLSTQDPEPGLLDVIGCRDIGDSILNECGVIDLAKLSIACKPTKEAIQLYNRRAHRIFPVRCGGFDHEYYTFWKELDRERADRATLRGTLGVDTLPRNDKPNNEASTEDGNGRSTLSPSSLSTRLQLQKSPSSITFIFDTPSIGDSLSLSGGTDEALHPSDPSRPTPEVNGLAARAKSNPPTPMLFSIGSAQACSTSSVSTAKTKRHRYFTRSSKRNNEG